MGKVGRETVDMMTHSLRSSEKKKKKEKNQGRSGLGWGSEKSKYPRLPFSEKVCYSSDIKTINLYLDFIFNIFVAD